MKKNVLINLIYSGLLALVGIVNLIIAFIVGDNGDIFFYVFCAMTALLLMSAGQILKIATKYADHVFHKVAKFWLNLAGVIGKYLSVIVGIIGVAMGLYTVGGSYQNYGFNTEEYQMMLIGFSILISMLFNNAIKKIDMILPNQNTQKSYEYFDKYGDLTLFPIVLGLNYLLSLFTMNFFINMLTLNALLIVYAIAYRQKSEEVVKYAKLNKVMSWAVIALPVIISVALAGGVGIFNSGYDSLDSATKFGAVLYSSMILYPCVAFVLFMCLYFITNKILYKKNKEVSMFGYVFVPIISFVVQILIFYYWYVGLIALAIIWVVLTILGLFMEIFSGPTNISANSLPKYYDKKYKYKNEIEKQMSYLQSIYTHIRGWNVKEVNGELVIEVVCKSTDAEYIKGIIREYLTNEIRFLYV